MRLSNIVFLLLLLTGCAAQKVAGPSPEYAPVVPQPRVASSVPTGSIFSRANADSWFGEKKTYRVGDVIMVMLDESMDADATASNKASKKTKNDVLSPLQLARWGSPGGFLSEDLQEENEISSEGSGVLDQSATFKGTMTAQVVEIYPNGNLLIRGEKIVNFSTGSEVIQVKGIIRPADVQPDNSVQSKRIASAQITYKGVGSSANAQRTPWGTNLLFTLWPF